MKKILFAVVLVMTLGFGAKAQHDHTDAFFNNWEQNDRLDLGGGSSFALPASHGFGEDTPSAPLGSGLLVLTALGAGYALKKKRKN